MVEYEHSSSPRKVVVLSPRREHDMLLIDGWLERCPVMHERDAGVADERLVCHARLLRILAVEYLVSTSRERAEDLLRPLTQIFPIKGRWISQCEHTTLFSIVSSSVFRRWR